MIFRRAAKSDFPEIRELWKKVFGDTDSFLDLYEQVAFHPENTWIAQKKDRIVSMSILYYHEDLVQKKKSYGPCPCVYAVATDPAFRGHGYAMSLIRMQAVYMDDHYPCSMISPADEGLDRIYERYFSYKDHFYCTKAMVPLQPEGAKTPENGKESPLLEPVTPATYNRIRESYLENRQHLQFTNEQLVFEKKSCRLSGGDLYRVRVNGAEGVCAVEITEEGHARINELLIEEEAMAEAVLFLSTKLKGCSLEVRTHPWVNGEKLLYWLHRKGFSQAEILENVPVAQIRFRPKERKKEEEAYAGFVFD
jgi:hypothetical protein